jgi:hypothetical protein
VTRTMTTLSVTYSWCSSSISSFVMAMKSLLSIFFLSAGLRLCLTTCLLAFAMRSSRSWKRSTILRIPRPGRVAETTFLTRHRCQIYLLSYWSSNKDTYIRFVGLLLPSSSSLPGVLLLAKASGRWALIISLSAARFSICEPVTAKSSALKDGLLVSFL